MEELSSSLVSRDRAFARQQYDVMSFVICGNATSMEHADNIEIEQLWPQSVASPMARMKTRVWTAEPWSCGRRLAPNGRDAVSTERGAGPASVWQFSPVDAEWTSR